MKKRLVKNHRYGCRCPQCNAIRNAPAPQQLELPAAETPAAPKPAAKKK